MKHLIETVLVLSALPMGALSLGLAVNACASLPSTGEQKAVVDTTCTLLTAYAGTPQEQAICAGADVALAIEQEIRAARADAGVSGLRARTGSKCQIVGSVCATDAELAMAISSRKDGGK